MDDALFWHRLQFAFTIIYHYLFPQLTMGLALLILVLKVQGLRTGERRWDEAARFWIQLFGINFAFGVATGIPMEMQLAANWAAFAKKTGAVVGHTLAMEGLFAFFLESSFLGLLLYGEKRLTRLQHTLAAGALFLGSWLSAYFIVATNSFLQHPRGHEVLPDGTLRLVDFWAFLLNPWALAAYAHTIIASCVTAAFVMAAVGAYYLLSARHEEQGRLYVRVGATAGLIASLLVAFPTGDVQAKLVAKYQPAALAAMEGRFESGPMAEITLIGQPNVAARRLDNPIRVPGMLSFLAFGTFHADVRGLDAFPESEWPTSIEPLYYAFHVMAGLGTILIGIMGLANLALWRGVLERWRLLLYLLLLSFPLPYIANTAGWITAEMGRQPWLVHGILRTREGASPTVHAGSTIFTLVGFAGLYSLFSLLFLFLVARHVGHGPGDHGPAGGDAHGPGRTPAPSSQPSSPEDVAPSATPGGAA